MATLHRALFTWFMLLIFVILLVLRLDDKAAWNWFIIFIPMWVFDGIIVIYILCHMISHCKSGPDRTGMTMARKVWFLISMMLKLTFQVLICVRLEYGSWLSLYYVMVPAWVLLIMVASDVTWGMKS